MGAQGVTPMLKSHLAPQGAGDEVVMSVSGIFSKFYLSFFFPAVTTCAEVWMSLHISPG